MTRMAGLLERMQSAYEDPKRRTLFLMWFWVASTGFLVFGFVAMFVILFLR